MYDPIDLSTPEVVLQYLDGLESFASHLVTPLYGGYSNFAYRIHLRKPYKKQSTLVLKYAAEHFSTRGTSESSTGAFPTVRQLYEVAALKLALKIQPEDSIITPPAVYHFDSNVHIIIMEDAGPDARTLKQLMIDMPLPESLADEIGVALGRFLSRIHGESKRPGFDLGVLANNELGKMLIGTFIYGRLASTITNTGEDNIEALSNPPMDVPQEKLDVISNLSTAKIKAINDANEIFIHGDFWTGNVMIRLDDSTGAPRLKHIYVLDWEVSRTGHPGFDVGQMCAELYLLQRFHAHCEGPAVRVRGAFLGAYRQQYEVDMDLARTAVVHIGAHLVIWPPRIGWGGREETRKLVEDGIDMLMEGSRGDEEWLQESLMQPLLS